MATVQVESYSIDSEGEADDFLASLLKEPQYRSVDEIEFRAAKYIKTPTLRAYFVERGKAMLRDLAPARPGVA